MLGHLSAAQERFDLVVMDSSHQYEHVTREWNITRSMSNTWIFHDTFQFEGPERVIEEIVSTGQHEVLSLRYPLGHQVHDCNAEGRNFGGLYHQRTLP